MWFLSNIISLLNNLSSFFYSLYLECYYAPYIPMSVASLFWNISSFFNDLAWNFYHFNRWALGIVDTMSHFLSWGEIWNKIYYYCQLAVSAWGWVYYSATIIANAINSWWSFVSLQVHIWIAEAKAWAEARITAVESLVNDILAWWNEFQPKIPSLNEVLSWFTNWWGRILANVISWGALPGSQISTLIDSKLRDWLPFYDDLAALWEDIKLFFTDPLQWLYDKAEEFMDRFW